MSAGSRTPLAFAEAEVEEEEENDMMLVDVDGTESYCLVVVSILLNRFQATTCYSYVIFFNTEWETFFVSLHDAKTRFSTLV